MLTYYTFINEATFQEGRNLKPELNKLTNSNLFIFFVNNIIGRKVRFTDINYNRTYEDIVTDVIYRDYRFYFKVNDTEYYPDFNSPIIVFEDGQPEYSKIQWFKKGKLEKDKLNDS